MVTIPGERLTIRNRPSRSVAVRAYPSFTLTSAPGSGSPLMTSSTRPSMTNEPVVSDCAALRPEAATAQRHTRNTKRKAVMPEFLENFDDDGVSASKNLHVRRLCNDVRGIGQSIPCRKQRGAVWISDGPVASL